MKLLPEYQSIARKLSSINPVESGMTNKGHLECQNIDHVLFSIKSTYSLGQLSAKLSMISIGDFIYAVADGVLCFDCPILDNQNGTFTKYDLTTQAAMNLERLAS